MSALQIIELFAGIRPDGQPMVERLPVKETEDGNCQLVKSPAFVKGIASDDVISFDHDSREFEIVRRSGKLAITVFCRGDMAELADSLVPEFEKLGGELDTENDRMLVLSIHVSCGFKAIETLLNDHMEEDSAWFYGNVYDPRDGVTPLNWWKDILNEK